MADSTFIFTELEIERARVRGAELQREANTPTLSPERLLDAAGMAEATGIPASWFLTAARCGEIPSHSFGRWLRFRLSEVMDHGHKHGVRHIVAAPRQSATPRLEPAQRDRKNNGKGAHA